MMKVIAIIFVLPMLIGLISGEFFSKKEKPWEASTNNHTRYVEEEFDALEYYKNKKW